MKNTMKSKVEKIYAEAEKRVKANWRYYQDALKDGNDKLAIHYRIKHANASRTSSLMRILLESKSEFPECDASMYID